MAGGFNMKQFRLCIASVLMLFLGWTSLAGATDYYVDATNGRKLSKLGTAINGWGTEHRKRDCP